MMQPVSLLGQQSFGAPQQAPQFEEEEEEDLFERNLLSGLASVGAAVEKSKSPPVTYRNYDFPEPPRTSALSVFTQGGDLKPGIDVNAITPSPQASPSLYAINTALNQEVPFESQISSGPDFSGMDVSLSPFTAGILDFFKRGVTQPQFGIMGFDPSQNPYGETLTEGLNKTPTAIPMGPQTQESISPFLQSPDTPSGLGGQLLDGFNRVNDSFREPNAPMTQAETRAMLQERFGAPTISAIQSLPSGQGMGMMTDAQGRMISQGDDRSAFNQASLDRLARLEERDVRPGETLQERDTRIADSRTEGTDRGGEMSFEEARKFVPKGAREKTKDYNARVKAFQAQQNSAISQLKEQYEEYRVQGQVLNNERIQAYINQYQQTEPEKYRETFQVAQEMLRDGILQDEVQAAMYVIEQMGGKVSDIFDPSVEFMRGDDGSKSNTSGATSIMMHPDGVQRRNVPVEQVEEAKAAGYTLI